MMKRSLRNRVLRLALVGVINEPLRQLLEDVLTEAGGRHRLGAPPRSSDVAIVTVSWCDDLRVIADARALVGAIPILAILPFGDDGLAMQVLLRGAQGWFALDTPLAQLRSVLDRLAGLEPTDEAA